MARKKKNDENKSGADVGMVMTCSLFLIILTFFILLNSIAVIDERKSRVAIGSLVGSFGSLSGGLSPMKTGESIMPPSAPLVAQALDFNRLLNQMDASIPDDVKIIRKAGREVISINEKLLFDPDTHFLRSIARPFLDQLSRHINQGAYTVDIIGHTDNRSADEKGYRSNWEITALMAVTVLKYLTSHGRVDPKRLTAFGRGSQDPVSSNETAQSRQQNRRVEIVLNYKVPEYIKKIFKENHSRIFTYKRFNFKVF